MPVILSGEAISQVAPGCLVMGGWGLVTPAATPEPCARLLRQAQDRVSPHIVLEHIGHCHICACASEIPDRRQCRCWHHRRNHAQSKGFSEDYVDIARLTPLSRLSGTATSKRMVNTHFCLALKRFACRVCLGHRVELSLNQSSVSCLAPAVLRTPNSLLIVSNTPRNMNETEIARQPQ